MRTTLLAISTVALLAGSTAIWAQGLPGGSENPQAPKAAHSTQHPMARPDEGNTGPGAVRPDESGPQGTRGNGMQPETDRNGSLQNTQLQGEDRDQTRGDREQDRDRMQGDRDRLQGGEMLRGGDVRGGAPHHLTIQQRTNLRETVLLRGPRLTHVSFRVGVGVRVPHNIHLVAVPQPIVALYPDWAGYLFFSYGEDIVVVEPDSMQIVGVLPV